VQIGIAPAIDEDRVLQGRQLPGSYPLQQFDFLGYTFRVRRVKNGDGEMFIGFVPAVSGAAAKAMRLTVRRWRLHHRDDLTLAEVAVWLRP
jgi:hypothetical protein